MGLGIGFGAAVIITGLALGPQPVGAQSPDEDRRSVRVAAGLVSQGGVFGDDHPLRSASRPGATLSIGIRRHPARLVGLAFETAFEPVPITNPHFDERVSRIHLQLGAEIGRRIYVRPTAGGAVNIWSGTRSSSGLSLGPAVALTVGYRHQSRDGIRIQPEVVVRAGGEVGVATWSGGAQIAISLPKW